MIVEDDPMAARHLEMVLDKMEAELARNLALLRSEQTTKLYQIGMDL